jgi:site-specific DNA recombinase
MLNEDSKIKYFLYARKSSESEDRQVQSIDDQVNRLERLAKDLDLRIVKKFTEAKSAKQPNNRPVFEDMLNRIEKGEADGMLCWQINRLSRNPVDSGKIAWLLQGEIIRSIQTIDKQYLPQDNVLMFSVESGMANQFIIDLRKNTKRGLAGKIERGWLPGRAPQGYLNDVLNKTIIKDLDRYDLIKKMWELMLTGSYLPPKILDMANNEWSFLTRKTKRAGGQPMSMSEIYRIFNDPFYYGYFKYNDKIYKGNHEPMITIEDYERVQELLGRKNKPRHITHEFSFTGIMRCGHCGCLVTAEEKKKFIKSTKQYATYVYYRCTRKKKELNCKEPAAKLESLEKQIVEEIGKYTIPEEFKNWALNVLKKDNEKEVEDRSKIYEMQNKKYLDLQKQLDTLTGLRIRELIEDDDFVKRKNELQNEIIKAQERLSSSQDRGQNWVDLVERAFNFVTYAREAFINGSIQTKREILSALGQNYVLKGGQLFIEPMDWLVPISNLKKIEIEPTIRFEPTKNRLSSQKNLSFATQKYQGGGYWESNPDHRDHNPVY